MMGNTQQSHGAYGNNDGPRNSNYLNANNVLIIYNKALNHSGGGACILFFRDIINIEYPTGQNKKQFGSNLKS